MYEYTNEIFQLKTDFVLYPRGNLKFKWVLRFLEKSPGFLLRSQSLVGVLGVCASSDVSSYYAHGKDWEAPWQPPGPALCCGSMDEGKEEGGNADTKDPHLHWTSQVKVKS